MSLQRKNRWYDKDEQLSILFETIKTMDRKKREELCSGIFELIKQFQENLIDDSVMEFPLDLPRRRWYDKDPYLWLIFNGLSHASDDLLEKVKAFLETHIKLPHRQCEKKKRRQSMAKSLSH